MIWPCLHGEHAMAQERRPHPLLLRILAERLRPTLSPNWTRATRQLWSGSPEGPSTVVRIGNAVLWCRHALPRIAAAGPRQLTAPVSPAGKTFDIAEVAVEV